MSDLSDRHEGIEAKSVRSSTGMRDGGGPHRALPWFVLLVLLTGLVCAAIFGPLLPRLFGGSNDVIGGATIIAVSIVLTGLLVAVAASLLVPMQSLSAVAAQVEEAKVQIRRGREDARAIVALRARMSVRSQT